MTGKIWQTVAVIVLIGLTGYFATARAALDRMTVARAARLVDEDRSGARRVAELLEDSSRTWSALTLMVLMPLVTAVAICTSLMLQWFVTPVAITVAVVLTTTLGYVGAELVPRSIALRRAEAVACRLAAGVALVSAALRPLTTLLVWLGARIVPGSEDGAEAFVTEEAIRDLIDEAEGQSIEPAERAMIHSIFELSDTLVREIMVPRPDVVMVSTALPLASVIEVILANGYSRIPVHEGDDRDDVSGVLYAKDVLKRLHTTGHEDGPWSDLVREPYIVPELKSVDGLLRELQDEQVHLAIVVDEYGALAGIATIEDVLEEIVGEIVDEYDSEVPLVEALADGHWRVDGRLPVGDLSELVAATLPSAEWDTVGGLLFGTLGHVPRQGESVVVDHLRLTADRVRGRRIAEVSVEVLNPTDDIDEREESHAVGGRREVAAADQDR